MGATIRYSEAFKQQVLCELEEGKLESIEQARRVYGIRGGGTMNTTSELVVSKCPPKWGV